MSSTKKSHKYKMCGAKTRAGTPCKRPAGWGTDHVGEGKCKLHGGKSKGAPKKNKNSERHGLFSKYLPNETKELVEEIRGISPLDILWGNIEIAYAAIIRAQKLMYVENQNILVKETRKETRFITDVTENYTDEFELQFAWDRQERFLTSQARAMTTLTNMIMRYDELLSKSELATEEQRLRNEKLKSEIKILTDNNESSTENKVADLMEGLLDEIDEETETSI